MVTLAAEFFQFEKDGFSPGVLGLKGLPVKGRSTVLHGCFDQLQIFSDELDFQHICPYYPSSCLNEAIHRVSGGGGSSFRGGERLYR